MWPRRAGRPPPRIEACLDRDATVLAHVPARRVDGRLRVLSPQHGAQHHPYAPGAVCPPITPKLERLARTRGKAGMIVWKGAYAGQRSSVSLLQHGPPRFCMAMPVPGTDPGAEAEVVRLDQRDGPPLRIRSGEVNGVRVALPRRGVGSARSASMLARARRGARIRAGPGVHVHRVDIRDVCEGIPIPMRQASI